MNTIIHYIREQTLEQFADAHSLTMEVHERNHTDYAPRFYCSFAGSEIKKGSLLRGVSGDGNTPEEAIANYGPQISEQLLVIDAWKDTRREIQVPRIIAKETK